MPRCDLLVVIVAYNNESTLAGVLDRLPAKLGKVERLRVLVLDDASPDGTFRAGLSWAEGSESRDVVWRNVGGPPTWQSSSGETSSPSAHSNTSSIRRRRSPSSTPKSNW